MNLRESIASQPMRAFQKRIIGICIALAFVDGFEVLVAAFTSTAVAKAFALPNAADIEMCIRDRSWAGSIGVAQAR